MSGPGAGGDLDRLLPVPEQTVGGGAVGPMSESMGRSRGSRKHQP